ncbi:SagB-type dehydrogenase domain-containing protein [Streptomyces zhaozhouensis]|uniref:SagB-type dehydrogenase domain-containing protein n=1 Tax=Streptomyces zhaozhouensis TaxID=1300267 RepID=A0A286DSE5_9ACTN|nr:nitroreductase family protein [Streptomyces zhaozhouensis]SOD61570.1 SagB-type dehydrogenase domain-containing protein [Streptomyces zhaozhouensis]
MSVDHHRGGRPATGAGTVLPGPAGPGPAEHGGEGRPAPAGAAGPALRRGLAVIAHEGGTIVQGGTRRHVFRGRTAREVLPALLPLLDGTRTRPRLCAAVGLSAPQLDAVLALLRRRGLLEERRGWGAERVADHVADFVSRGVEWTGAHRDAGGWLDALGRTCALVYGPAGTAGVIAADLAESGVGHTGTPPPPGRAPEQAPAAPASRGAARTLLVVVDEPGQDGLLERVAAQGAAWDVPVLRVAVDGARVELGPVFLSGYTACVACCRAGRAAAGWGEPRAVDPDTRDLLAGLACSEALALLGGSSTTAPARTLRAVSVPDGRSERFFVAPEPGCPACGTGPAAEDGAAVAELYEWTVERPPPPAVRPGDPPQDVAARWADLAGDRPARSFLTRPRCPLPAARLPVPGTFGVRTARPAGDPSGTAEIADVLARVGGFRDIDDPAAGRWAPSGGSLASVELYLLTREGQVDLPGTVFRYDDTRHELIAVRPEPVPLDRALRSTDLRAEDVGHVLVMVAAHQRLAAKYGGFAYRLAQLDAGCATTQLSAVLHSRGASVDFASAWGPDLAVTLDLVPGDQYVTAVAAVGAPPRAPRAHAPREN